MVIGMQVIIIVTTQDYGYTIDSELVNAGDGDSNFKYTGPTSLRILTIDYAAKTITVD